MTSISSFPSTPSLWQPWLNCFCEFFVFYISHISDTIQHLSFCLVYFTWYNVLQFHHCCCKWQNFLLFHERISHTYLLFLRLSTERTKTSFSECSAVISAFFECLRFIMQQNLGEEAIEEMLVNDQVFML